MFDESIDKSITEKVLLYVRYDDVARGELQTKLLAVAPIKKGIQMLITFFLLSKMYWVQKVLIYHLLNLYAKHQMELQQFYQTFKELQLKLNQHSTQSCSFRTGLTTDLS